jgi:hypothetical protein
LALHWRKNIAIIPDVLRKAIRSVTLLTVWVVWKEHVRVFDRNEASALSMVAKVKSEANAWITAERRTLQSS